MRPFVQLDRAVHALRNDHEKNIPDVIGHYPNAAAGGRPYLEGQMKSVRTVTLPFPANAPFVVYPGDRSDVKGDEAALVEKDLKGEFVDGGETAKWCVFSFVVKSRSLAIGQVGMEGVFAASTDLNKEYKDKFTNRHYGHSFQFRSNIQDTWGLWEEIMEGIRANSGKAVK